MKYQDELINLVKNSSLLMHSLKCIRELSGDFWLGGGAIRNMVWDASHGTSHTPSDYDVIYFNEEDNSLEADMTLYYQLRKIEPTYEWQVVNQLRKIKCLNLIDGIRQWSGIASCVTLKLNHSDEIEILAPYGLDILFNLILMRNCSKEYYDTLIESKQWLKKYPKLKLIRIN